MFINRLLSFIRDIRVILIIFSLLFSVSNFAIAAEKQTFEAETAELIGDAIKVADSAASGDYLVSLAKPGQSVKFKDVPAYSKLAIRYASVEVGTISVAVNDQSVHKVNVHSSGALTGSFLHAIIDVEIPANATVTISLFGNDVAVNIDRIIVGDGDLGLPPDIWNLPPLKVADGPYAADWKELSRLYSVPEWWRDAKFGAWAHWDPQSMPEQGDWYARGMYMQGNRQYNFHISNFGHPSEYGYKDICNNWVIDKWNPDELMDLYIEMGARYFLAMGVHHDNFDCWNSKYQPWNSVNVGPKVDVVINLKCVGGRYNSFKNNPELIPIVERALVKSSEAIIEPEIMAYPFQTETTIQDWHYRTGQRYIDSKKLIGLLMDNVCRNGTMLLNLTQHGRGDLDPEVTRIAKDIGAWLKVNGEAVYSSRPFEVYGEDSVRYTRNKGNVYATLLDWQGGTITMKALHAGGATIGKVTKVEMLGFDIEMTFVQNEQGLTVTPEGQAESILGIDNQSLSSAYRVLRITHDKGWFNDDDPGAAYTGWTRQCNLGSGDFNNVLTISDTPGDAWSCSFTGSSVSVIAPKEYGAGKIEIQIDGESRATEDLSTTGSRIAQQNVCEVTGLASGKHAIKIINRGPGTVAIDAIIVW